MYKITNMILEKMLAQDFSERGDSSTISHNLLVYVQSLPINYEKNDKEVIYKSPRGSPSLPRKTSEGGLTFPSNLVVYILATPWSVRVLTLFCSFTLLKMYCVKKNGSKKKKNYLLCEKK